ncbi:hypothetical protein [Nonomuraea wenchangensis]|uniref:Uncharacterized protein n=1 Tax=Nonomuraea wenchangensis TaxID=568860 RepID=A0A1I0EFF4_9ACTN|nr:hypothetical protein [Nonomuraea wenchangensis]SET43743.1 hypothetical protein SAMN05421811_10323 [Nonomuraea wenchangensis]
MTVTERPSSLPLPIIGQLAEQSGIVGFCLAATVLLIILGVIYPAVWSRKTARRKAAVEVIDRIFRRRR